MPGVCAALSGSELEGSEDVRPTLDERFFLHRRLEPHRRAFLGGAGASKL